MKFSWLAVPALAMVLVACGDSRTGGDAKPATNRPPAASVVLSASNDGITLSTASPERVTGVYADANGIDMLQFDLAKVADNIFADVTGNGGRPIPASLVLHKMGRQSADALGIHLKPLDAPGAADGYCQAYPNTGNDCYGMCGPDCSCWSWVCGDCCYHYGCAVHDNWCREGEWYFCYDITAVIALFGC